MENRNKIPEIRGECGMEKCVISSLPMRIIDMIYSAQKRAYWEEDFINRCLDRRAEGTGRCNLTHESMKDKFDIAYDIYNRTEDCNVLYNETLDAVIDEVEQKVSKGLI